jgi:WD40 repeat protein
MESNHNHIVQGSYNNVVKIFNINTGMVSSNSDIDIIKTMLISINTFVYASKKPRFLQI